MVHIVIVLRVRGQRKQLSKKETWLRFPLDAFDKLCIYLMGEKRKNLFPMPSCLLQIL